MLLELLNEGQGSVAALFSEEVALLIDLNTTVVDPNKVLLCDLDLRLDFLICRYAYEVIYIYTYISIYLLPCGVQWNRHRPTCSGQRCLSDQRSGARALPLVWH